MWLFTTSGFLSVVQHNSMPERFQIKSRTADALRELWPDYEIEIIDWADYRFRITIEKSKALPVLFGVMCSVDYTSFKGAFQPSSRYHMMLTKVWNIMYSYQSEMESLI